MQALEDEMEALVARLPNSTHASTPLGDESAAVRVGSSEARGYHARAFDFEPRTHVELGDALGIFDFEAARHLDPRLLALPPLCKRAP